MALKPLAGVLFKPLTPGYSFRWGGEFSPHTRGPQAYSQSTPLPLPSTTAGALAGVILSLTGESLCSETGVYGDTLHGLRRLGGTGCSRVALRGPYLYARQGEEWLLCMPAGRGQGLFCVASRGGNIAAYKVTPPTLQSIGIALDNLSKTTITELIYTAVYTDPLSALQAASKAGGLSITPWSTKTAGILVEVYADESCENNVKVVNGAVVQLGGETRPAEIHVTQHTPGLELARSLTERGYYLYVATPILLPSEDLVDVDREAVSVIRDVIGGIGLETNASRPVVRGRLRLSAIGLGYSLCRDRRRPYNAAILPGVVLDAHPSGGRSLEEAYMAGFGKYSEVGWGTLLPIPRAALQGDSGG